MMELWDFTQNFQPSSNLDRIDLKFCFAEHASVDLQLKKSSSILVFALEKVSSDVFY